MDNATMAVIVIGFINLLLVFLGWSLKQQFKDALRRIAHLELQVEQMKTNYLDRFDEVKDHIGKVLVVQARMEVTLSNIDRKCSLIPHP